MDKLRIVGGRPLSGRVAVGGSKNAALPVLAATLLTEERVEVSNLPNVRDVRTMLRVLEQLGATVEDRGGGRASVQVGRLRSHEAPYDLVKTMRASVLVLGPLLARFGKARVSLPGGCAIGERPINLHIEGLQKMGAKIRLEHGYVEAEVAGRLRGAAITFPGDDGLHEPRRQQERLFVRRGPYTARHADGRCGNRLEPECAMAAGRIGLRDHDGHAGSQRRSGDERHE